VHFAERLYREQKLNLPRNRITPGSRAFITISNSATSRAESSFFTKRLERLCGASRNRKIILRIRQGRDWLLIIADSSNGFVRAEICGESSGLVAFILSSSRVFVNNFSLRSAARVSSSRLRGTRASTWSYEFFIARFCSLQILLHERFMPRQH